MIRTLIVEDELPARQWLRTLCDRVSGIQVVKECATAAEASRTLRERAIDLVLLDIELGPHNGFEVLDHMPDSGEPHLVIVTAHDEYAVRAFENRAIDYLPSPCARIASATRLREFATRCAMESSVGRIPPTASVPLLLATVRRHARAAAWSASRRNATAHSG